MHPRAMDVGLVGQDERRRDRADRVATIAVAGAAASPGAASPPCCLGANLLLPRMCRSVGNALSSCFWIFWAMVSPPRSICEPLYHEAHGMGIAAPPCTPDRRAAAI